MSLLPTTRGCLFCGPAHPFGLRLELHYEQDKVTTQFSVATTLSGYENTVHGGIVSGILDEVMWWAVTVAVRQISMTRKMELEFLNPMSCGVAYRARGYLAEKRHRVFLASGEIEEARSGIVAARARGLFMPTKTIEKEAFAASFDLTRLSPEMRAIFSALLA